MTADPWQAFTASLTPAHLEQERMRMPTDSERPGSSADLRMRVQHAARVHQFKAARESDAARTRLQVATKEASTFTPYQFGADDIQIAKAHLGARRNAA